MYLLCGIKTDIIFVVRKLSRHNTDLKKKHLGVTKQIVRYLKRTAKMVLIFGQKSVEWLSRDPSPYKLVDYIDSNFAKDPGD